MKAFKLLFGALMVGSLSTAGCAVQSESVEPSDDETELTGEQSSELAVANLKGTWNGPGPIYKLEFTNEYAETLGGGLKGRKFHANIDTGIRCITTPCPSDTDVTGVYKIKGSKLTLASYDRPSLEFSKILGDYKATQSSAGKKLKLTKQDSGLVESFTKAKPGVACGTTTCGEGFVCCNPLRNICTPPGMMCIQ